ncbi:MAG: ankyrin repeat domain-containing protein, partial [Verrucomicrobia bacterium]|nr:ankyrin repeat domain-containing protein [Verrucomicrobiota bacterium]
MQRGLFVFALGCALAFSSAAQSVRLGAPSPGYSVQDKLPSNADQWEPEQLRALFKSASSNLVNDARVGSTPLIYRAAESDNLEAVETLLELGADPNATGNTTYNGSRLTAAGAAAMRGHWDMVHLLVEKGADVNGGGSYRGSLLAASIGNSYTRRGANPPLHTQAEVTALLLQRGADPFGAAQNSYGGSGVVSVLDSAFMGSRDDTGDLLLTNSLPSSRSTNGETLLHVAARWGRTNALVILLDRGLDPNATNRAGLTPLHVVALLPPAPPPPPPPTNLPTRGTTTISVNGGTFIVNQGVVGFPTINGFVGGPGARRHAASDALQNKDAVAELLLRRGAATDVFSAAALGRTNDLEKFVIGDTSCLSACDSAGRSPLHWAGAANATNAVEWLLRHGANVNAAVGDARFDGPAASSPAPVSVPNLSGFVVYGVYPVASVREPLGTPGRRPLHFAVERGNVETARRLLDGGAPVNAGDRRGDRALHVAAMLGRTNLIELLATAGANLNATNALGFTPLGMAVLSQQSFAFAQLHQLGACVDTLSLGSNTLLHVAASNANLNAIQQLLQRRVPVNARNAAGQTALHLAVASGSLDLLRELAHAGADLNATDAAGDTPLHYAARISYDQLYSPPPLPWWGKLAAKSPTFARFVLPFMSKRGWVGGPPAVSGLTPPANILLGSSFGISAGTMPQMTSRLDELLDLGARPNVTNRLGATPLHLLIQPNSGFAGDSLGRLQHLKRAGAKLDALDAQGRMAIHIAAGAGNQTALTNLITAGADINARDREGRTALHHAVTNRNYSRELIPLLLTNRADVNAVDARGQTPGMTLFAGVERNYDGLQTFQSLLHAGLKMDHRAADGSTYLHYLVRERYNGTEVAKLIDRSFTSPELINVTNRAGDSALHVALRTDDWQMVEMLAKRGAEFSLRNARGESGWLLLNRNFQFYSYGSLGQPGVSDTFFNAIQGRKESEVREWLKREPALANVVGRDGRSAMEVAARGGATDMVRLLTDSGAKLDLRSAIVLGRTNDVPALVAERKPSPVELSELAREAINARQPAVSRQLVEAGADLGVIEGNGYSLAGFARFTGQPDLAAYFEQRGSPRTVFDLVQARDGEKLRALLATNRSLAALTNASRSTPLHLAAQLGDA